MNKSDAYTLSPELSKLINTCRGKGTDFRVLLETEEQDKKIHTRLTIVVKKNGTVVKQYWG